MQRAEESETRGGGLSPLQAFLIAIGVLVALGALVMLVRPDEPALLSPDTNTEPAFALTDAEAIARFKELEAAQLAAYRSADVSVVSQVFTSNSPLRATAVKEIRSLSRADVSGRTRFVTENFELLTKTSAEIRILQTVVVHPRFVDANGNEVTAGGRVERQRVRWTLRLEGSTWLIHDALITFAEPIGGKG